VNNFKLLDIAQCLLAGTGSLGMDRYYVLLQDDAENVIHIIDFKQQCLPSPYPYMGASTQELFLKHGEDNAAKAVVVATQSMSAHPDPFLGYLQLGKMVSSVQDHNPYKGLYPALLEEATKKFKKLGLESKKQYTHLAEQWAWLLASHHAYARRGNEKESVEKNIVELVGDQDNC
jgi:uncharacterized protein (DUF2252 family)